MRYRTLCATTLFAVVATAASAATPTDHQRIVALPGKDGAHRAYHEYTYADAVRVGDTIWVSGVTGRGATLAEQTRFALGRIKRAIEEAGGTMDDVVEMQSYHIDIRLETFGEIAEVRREFFPGGFTAWTAVGTSGLLAPGALMEVRAIAVVGSSKRKVGVPPAPPKA